SKPLNPDNSMRVLRKIFALLIALISLAVFGLCAAGIYGAWSVKKPLLDNTTRTFDHAQRALQITAETVDLVNAGLQKAQTQLTAVKVVSGADKGAQKPGFFGMITSRALAQQLGPQLNDVRRTLDVVTETSVVINSVLDGVKELPLTSV